MTKTQTKNPQPKASGKTTRRRSAQKATSANGRDNMPGDAVDAASSGKRTKLDLLTSLLRGPNGASIAELTEATGWQSHSVRGAMSGALKRKGLAVTSEVTVGVRRYRIGVPQ